MALRFNPPPNWPSPPAGWSPPPGWTPDPAWGPAPEGWQLWAEDLHTDDSSPATAAVPNVTHASWFARHKMLAGIGAVVVLLVVVGTVNAASGDGPEAPASASTQEVERAGSTEESDAEAEAQRQAEQEASAAAQAEKDRIAEEKRVADEAVAAAEAARVGTVGQQNAHRSAVNYLEYTAFSRSGLVGQLQFEGYSAEEAEFALARLEAEGGVDWNAQAAASAANYLDYTAFSRSGLVDQLVFEGFTPEQAEYGVSTTGL